MRFALAHHPHLCQTAWDADGRRYPGFFCPRLSDTSEEAYCCHLQAAGDSCCTRSEFGALYQINLSALPPPPVFRGPGPLLALGLYSLLLVALMTADLVHFCRGRGRGRDLGRDLGRDRARAATSAPLGPPPRAPCRSRREQTKRAWGFSAPADPGRAPCPSSRRALALATPLPCHRL
ncbi:protein shisa-like-1 [Megaptera novaeangliae]